MENITIGDLSIPKLAAEAKVDPQTVWNWINRGVKVRGKYVRLAADKIGGRWRSDLVRLQAFLRQTRPATVQAEPAQTEGRRRKAVQRAIREAKAAGIMTP